MSELTDGPLDDAELASIINQNLAEGLGSDQDELVGERNTAVSHPSLPK